MNFLSRLLSLVTGAADADERDARESAKLRELARKARIDAAHYASLVTMRTRAAEELERRAALLEGVDPP